MTKLFFSLMLCLASAISLAQDLPPSPTTKAQFLHEHRSEFYLGLGSSKDNGYIFSDGQTSRSTELGMRFWNPSFGERKYRGFFEFNFVGMERQSVNEAKFPFTVGTNATVGMFAVTPNWTFVSNDHWNVFVGLGPVLITIRDADNNNEQTYGSFIWQGGVVYEIDENWNLGLKTAWTKITQKTNGQSYFQEFWNSNLFLSYAPDWMNGR